MLELDLAKNLALYGFLWSFSLGSSLVIVLIFILYFPFLVKNDSLGNFDFLWQCH